MSVEEFKRRAVSFDTETHSIVPGILAPPVVCGSTASAIEPVGAFVSRGELGGILPYILCADTIIVGANIAYDMAVIAAEAFRTSGGESMLDAIFAKYDRDEVYDVQIAQALDAIAGGHLYKDPHTGGDLIDPATGKKGRYSLSTCVRLVLGRTDAKKNDFWRKRYAILERVPREHWPVEALQYPVDDAVNTLEVAFVQVNTLRNLHEMPAQARAAFALQLACAWGLRTHGPSVDKLESEALDCARVGKEHAADGTCCRIAGADRWRKDGFLLEGEGKDGADKKAGRVVKARLARAYGATKACASCAGTGKILNAKGKAKVFCTDKNIAGRAPYGFGCDGTGLDLGDAPMLARTPTGGIAAGRDDLAESGDEELMGFAQYQEDDKLLTVYVPFLRKGVHQPLNPRSNVLVASGRVSYDEVFQQQPRDGGIRECFEARPGTVYCSTDYASGELCTLAQVTLWVVGRSKMADVINETKDPGALHTAYGAKLIGVTPAELTARIKAGDATAKGYRQAAKALNFGLPGGMGAAKLVLAKRKKSEGTTKGPDGRVYNGIRFCILVGGAERCGVDMVTVWRDRPTAPVCRRCVELAEALKREWLGFFDEMPAYFDWVSRNVNATGELTQFVSRRVRGGLSFCDGANTLFQGLLADGAKRSLWLVSREMYTDRNSALYGSRVTAFFHDEVFSEMPEDLAPAGGIRQAALMIEGLKEFVPDVHVACDPALMRRWSKAAEPVFVDGKLAVWEPKEKTK